MKQSDDHWELSAIEMKWTQATGWLAAILLAGFTHAVLLRFLHVHPALAMSISFLVLSLPLYIPMKLIQARRNHALTLSRYVAASVVGAVIAGAVGLAFGF